MDKKKKLAALKGYKNKHTQLMEVEANAKSLRTEVYEEVGALLPALREIIKAHGVNVTKNDHAFGQILENGVVVMIKSKKSIHKALKDKDISEIQQKINSNLKRQRFPFTVHFDSIYYL